MHLKVTLTQNEVLARNKAGELNPDFPHDGKCKSGHLVPPGTRFFHVSGPALPKERWGIYCEPCLCVANKMARRKKKNKKQNKTKNKTKQNKEQNKQYDNA